MTPVESMHWLENNMVPYFPLGDFKVHPAIAGLRF